MPHPVNGQRIRGGAHTEPPTLDLFRGQGEHLEYFGHDLDNQVYHNLGGRNVGIYFKAFQETAQVVEEIEKGVIT